MSWRYVRHVFRGCNHERYYISWNLARVQVFMPASRRLPRAWKTSKRFQRVIYTFFPPPIIYPFEYSNWIFIVVEIFWENVQHVTNALTFSSLLLKSIRQENDYCRSTSKENISSGTRQTIFKFLYPFHSPFSRNFSIKKGSSINYIKCFLNPDFDDTINTRINTNPPLSIIHSNKFLIPRQ